MIEQQGGSVRPLLSQVGFDITVLLKDWQKSSMVLLSYKIRLGYASLPECSRLLNLADKLAQTNNDQFISRSSLVR